jgi:hypothetical protein
MSRFGPGRTLRTTVRPWLALVILAGGVAAALALRSML